MKVQNLFIPTFRVEECLNEIRDSFEKGWTGIGDKTNKFEEQWNKYTGHICSHFLNSATSGLHLAIDTLKDEYGWDKDDEVISTPITFVSTNHAVLYTGLKIVFADVDEYLCIDPQDLVKKISSRTKAVIFVGIGGNVGKFLDVVEVCRKHNLKLILDAAHMAGTRLEGEKTPGLLADVAVYSFQAVKNLPTADSGMISFNSPKLDKIARKKSWLGISKDTFARTEDKGTYKWNYDVEYVGYKYNGNSLMAGIGLVQLKYLDEDNARRNKIAELYNQYLDSIENIRLILVAPSCHSSRHLYQIVAENRDELMLYLNQNNIFPGVHYVDNSCYKMYEFLHGTCPNAHNIHKKILSLPIHLRLSQDDIYCISDHIRKFYNK